MVIVVNCFWACFECAKRVVVNQRTAGWVRVEPHRDLWISGTASKAVTDGCGCELRLVASSVLAIAAVCGLATVSVSRHSSVSSCHRACGLTWCTHLPCFRHPAFSLLASDYYGPLLLALSLRYSGAGGLRGRQSSSPSPRAIYGSRSSRPQQNTFIILVHHTYIIPSS